MSLKQKDVNEVLFYISYEPYFFEYGSNKLKERQQ